LQVLPTTLHETSVIETVVAMSFACCRDRADIYRRDNRGALLSRSFELGYHRVIALG
jgi:hypothetical protein